MVPAPAPQTATYGQRSNKLNVGLSDPVVVPQGRSYLSCGPEGVGVYPSWSKAQKRQANRECAADLRARR